MRPERIVLTGLSGSGKSTVARLLADRLGWESIDTDGLIQARSGRSAASIFGTDGEDAFRALEREALEQCARADRAVIATGGGAILSAECRRAMASGFVVWLAITPQTAANRLLADPTAEQRPLLKGAPNSSLVALLRARTPYYERADAAVDVESLTPEQVADEIVALWNDARGQPAPSLDRLDPERNGATPAAARSAPIEVKTRVREQSYPVIVEAGALALVGLTCQEVGLHGRAFIVTDTSVGPLFAPVVQHCLTECGYAPQTLEVPHGEANKTLATVALVHDWLIDQRAERSDFVVCLGGGVVTDLGGFAAASFLRGIDFVHVPTTLLGMLDAAIGGKTGVDHPRGKNLIGAFAQPRAVIADPDVLASLPARELTAGWAEMVKHALILDAPLAAELEAAATDPATLTSPRLIAWSIAIKARVVSEDEREAGLRMLLNYGHTIGHAIEAVSGYGPIRHGEAVAVGMRAAGLIAVELGLLSDAELQRQQALIRAYNLPESAPGLDPDAIIQATMLDKKVRSGAVNWVLLDSIGSAVIRSDVPAEVVRRAVETVVE